MQRRIQPLSVMLFIFDMIIVILGLLVSAWMRSNIPFGRTGALAESQTQLPWVIYPLAILIYAMLFITNYVYDPKRVLRWYQEAARVWWAVTMATTLMAGAMYFIYRELSRLQFIYFYAVALFLMLAMRAILRVWYRLEGRYRPGGRTKILILGAGDLGQRVAAALLDHSRWGYDLIGFLDDDSGKQSQEYLGLNVLGGIDQVNELVTQRSVEEVWITLPVNAHEKINRVVLQVDQLPVRVKIVPDYFSLALIRAKADILAGISVIGLREPVIEGLPRLLKRVFDLVFVSGLLLAFAPLMIFIAIAIKLDSRGPVLYRQKRVGENWHHFEMLKFRTMVADAERRIDEVAMQTADGSIIHKRPDDPRVTRMGRFLRRYSLDELPQFINVLKGDMSLVGPRPEMPWLVDRYEPWQRKRFAVPQGVTGWWQINGRSDKPMHLNTDYDLYYVYNYSIWLDLMILLRTPGVVLRGRGAF
jgi:exopolysaccharide biosynthesis polyprenyl glycosylphosphotransferase